VGVVSTEIAPRAFATAPLLANIREVVGDIHDRDERACLITISPGYFAELFESSGSTACSC
jgi:phosphoserine phosphatase